MGDTAKISIAGKTIELPILKGTTGPDVVDIRKFYAESDAFTYDPGFTSTASCESKITFIDGDAGILLHRGYQIGELAEKSTFLDTCYLLLHGELPNAAQYSEFEHTITYHTMLHEQFDRFFQGFRRDAHPMAIMTGAVGALSAFYHDSTDINDPEQRMISAHRLIAKMPTIAARAFKYFQGQPFVHPRNDLSYAENFLRMCFSVPAEDWKPNPVLTKAMDRIFILHADHEQNASTSTVRLAGSSGANPFACIAAGIACLWGPAHGGANEEALNMLKEIGTVDRIPEYIQGVKDRRYRLMGFGHRVYRVRDPRADALKRAVRVLGAQSNILPGRLAFAEAVERAALAILKERKPDRSLQTNVEFYTALLLEALAFPPAAFTCVFAMGRTAGWIAHAREQLAEGRLIRPQSRYVGPQPRAAA